MPAPLLAPAGQLQGWIFTDLLTDLGVHANLCDGHCTAAAFRCVLTAPGGGLGPITVASRRSR